MKSRSRTLPFLLIFALLTACGQANRGSEANHDLAQSTPVPSQKAGYRSDGPKVAPNPTSKKTEMMIRTADVRMRVADHAASEAKITQLVARHEGYIGGENASGDTIYQETRLMIRVPNAQFDDLVDGIVALAEVLDHKNISSQDVGEEYVDLNSRLSARKAGEAAYLEILRSARKVTDILEVQERLRRVREEIESTEGRMRYLRDQVAYSTITVTFYESHQVAAAAESGAGLGDRISVAFLNGWNIFLSGLVLLTHLWPLWLLVIAFFILRKQILLRRQTPKAANS
ncbi:MAG: DUF4349 domain-containing protein [Bacteroidota bacterium]